MCWTRLQELSLSTAMPIVLIFKNNKLSWRKPVLGSQREISFQFQHVSFPAETHDPEFITDQNDPFASDIFPSSDDKQIDASETDRRTDRTAERLTDVMSVCTFLPQLAETPVQQSQDKAHEYGLDRLQYGWLKGRGVGGERG